MKEYYYLVIGEILICIGSISILFPLLPVIFIFGIFQYEPVLPPQSAIPVLFGVGFGGFIMASIGVIIKRKYREMPSYLTKPDEPIHFGKPWRKESEPGLFLTSCELVVSINDASEETTHVGYRLIAAKHATCSDCIKREGRDILESVQYHRSYILL